MRITFLGFYKKIKMIFFLGKTFFVMNEIPWRNKDVVMLQMQMIMITLCHYFVFVGHNFFTVYVYSYPVIYFLL